MHVDLLDPRTFEAGVPYDFFAWLRENFDPVGTVAYAYLVYEIPREALDRLR